MRPIDQTKFGKDKGDCFAACIASILELDLEVVPNFCVDNPPRWYADASDWVQEHGYTLICIDDGDLQKVSMIFDKCLRIVSGQSPREDCLHAVIARGHTMIHDPHPSRAGLKEPILDHIFFVANDPQSIVLARASGIIGMPNLEDHYR